MKKFVILIILLTFCSSCKQKEKSNEDEVLINSISCEDVKDNKIEGSFLIDVRSPLEYEKGTLKGAINIPINMIENNIESYVKDKTENIIVFCQSGSRSEEAANILKKLGYKNIFDLGSINNCN